MQISIKDATLNDLNEVNSILRISKSYWAYNKEFIDIFMENFGITPEYLENHIIKLFYIDGRLAGFYNFEINADNLFELANFFLHPDFIGKGIGKVLWDSCCQTAIEKGKYEFILWSDPNAESFYLKMGCEKIGVRQSPMMPDRYPTILKFKIKQ
ncbi:MAG: GNAT family N-acetyltransferase [Gammaproteobacteria bacterium]|nr:GNAT family N-acetyltransferase [Gammaproteobacteria bacterium]